MVPEISLGYFSPKTWKIILMAALQLVGINMTLKK
jgi:hypothetical protein